MTAIFGLTTRGLESISAREMAALSGLHVSETAYRRVAAQCDGSLEALLKLRALDDVFLQIATWNDIGHTRDMLKTFTELSQGLDLQAGAELCGQFRRINTPPAFSVTASFVGKRNYSSDEIKIAISEGVQTRFGWNYAADDREADFNLRVFIEHEVAYFGLRLGERPLHERGGKPVERPASLKPPVAAALLLLAEVEVGLSLLDPCCGTGTILMEAAGMGASVRGGDIEAEAVSAARTNLTAVGIHAAVEKWDARALPLRDGMFQRIVTNLPWGRQVAVDDHLESFYRDCCAEIERVLSSDGKVAVLTSLPHLLHFEHLRPVQTLEISLYGQKPTIVLFAP